MKQILIAMMLVITTSISGQVSYFFNQLSEYNPLPNCKTRIYTVDSSDIKNRYIDALQTLQESWDNFAPQGYEIVMPPNIFVTQGYSKKDYEANLCDHYFPHRVEVKYQAPNYRVKVWVCAKVCVDVDPTPITLSSLQLTENDGILDILTENITQDQLDLYYSADNLTFTPMVRNVGFPFIPTLKTELNYFYVSSPETKSNVVLIKSTDNRRKTLYFNHLKIKYEDRNN